MAEKKYDNESFGWITMSWVKKHAGEAATFACGIWTSLIFETRLALLNEKEIRIRPGMPDSYWETHTEEGYMKSLADSDSLLAVASHIHVKDRERLVLALMVLRMKQNLEWRETAEPHEVEDAMSRHRQATEIVMQGTHDPATDFRDKVLSGQDKLDRKTFADDMESLWT